MGYKLNICVPAPVTEEVSGVVVCPVCEGIDIEGCTFCLGTGEVTEEKLATYTSE